MNYEELYAIIPKMHWQWNVEDTALWLEFIGLPSLQNKFRNVLLIYKPAQLTAVSSANSAKTT